VRRCANDPAPLRRNLSIFQMLGTSSAFFIALQRKVYSSPYLAIFAYSFLREILSSFAA
jgi:hypothetical protein